MQMPVVLAVEFQTSGDIALLDLSTPSPVYRSINDLQFRSSYAVYFFHTSIY
ncbi:hypothetical protein DL89DRAFT_270074 [Linderina pennispora]|uniref:Uncharacterized protein n=1 Tax=Linderina pennispora TaxID=61395 RepID=A0A1Y1VZU8_9FUNG|nr:uncharacterized protein DL89DRAFT_270074 [Linderina pennispora]ORX66536.1 hypothetical protein DL89DRAFT_270074 [Linderina pennispora]